MEIILFILGVICGCALALAIIFAYFHFKAKKFAKDVSSVYEKQLQDIFDKY